MAFKITLLVCLVGAVMCEPPVAPYPASGGPQGGGFGLPEVVANRAQDNSPTHTITFNLFKDHQPQGKEARDQERQGGFQQGYSQGAVQKYSQDRAQPSQKYGAPRSQLSQNYGAPRSQPSQSHGAPQNYQGQLSSSYGTPESRSTPSQNYGTPQAFSAPSSSNGAAQNYASQPSNSYGAPQNYASQSSHSSGPPQNYASQPNQNYGAPSLARNSPSETYGAPSRSGPSANYGVPSQSYGTPSFRMDQHSANSLGRNAQQKSLKPTYGAPKATYGVPDNTYGAPQTRMGDNNYAGARSFDSDGSSEMPHEVNYEFEYEVHGDRTHSHEESREGEDARGSYRVQLPDGRVQLVEYTADRRGFRPRISYLAGEDAGGPY